MSHQPFADLDDETADALRKSIARFGVVSPVIVDGNGRIIDGHQRARIAGELGLTYPIIKRSVRNDDDAMALAVSLNVDRRQLDPEQRRAIVADLRAQGYSLRAIAGVTKTSLGTVHSDAQRAGVQPEHVTGQDGKTYAASQPERTPPPGVDPETGEIQSSGEEDEPVATGSGSGEGVAPGQTREAPSPSSPVPSPALVMMADLSRLRAEVAKWMAFDRHEQVIDAMTAEQRADYRSFLLSVFNHASAAIDLLDAPARLAAVPS